MAMGREMLRLKSCPKCKTGAVGLDRDYHGWYVYCIQCGYSHDLRIRVELKHQQHCSAKEIHRKVVTLARQSIGG